MFKIGLKKTKMDILIATVSIKEKSRIHTLNISNFEDIPGIQLLK